MLLLEWRVLAYVLGTETLLPWKETRAELRPSGPVNISWCAEETIWSVCRHRKSQGSSRVSCSQNKSLVETGNACCSSCCSRCAAAGKQILEEHLPMILSVVFIKPKKNQPKISQWLSEEQKLNLGLLMCWNTAKMFSQQTLRTQQPGSKVINQKFKQKLQSLERTQRFGDAKPKRSKTNLNWNIVQTFLVFCQFYVSGVPAEGPQFSAM